MVGFILIVFLMAWEQCPGDVAFPGTLDMSQVKEAGKDQFEILNRRQYHAQYGYCWKNAISHLNEGCKNLNEEIQSEIALKFTDCFLKMSGHEFYECDKSFGVLRKECMQGMSERAFNVYVEFYTHTQNICFYLQSHVWHEETERTIDRLTSSSAKVTEQLEQAEQIQNTIFQHQKDSMEIQQELLEHGLTLREIMHDFSTSAVEQKKLLFDLFSRLSSLQEWAMGEISWLDSVVFYLSSVILCYIISATPQTHDARLYMFIILTVNAVMERVICVNFLVDGNDHLETVNENLYWWIWLCRKITIAVCAAVLGITIHFYRDYIKINNSLLHQIQEQNMKILSFVEKNKLWKTEVGSENGRVMGIKTSDYYHIETASDADSPSTHVRCPKPVHSPNVSSLSDPVPAEVHSSTVNRVSKTDLTERSGSPSPSAVSSRSVSSYTEQYTLTRRKPLSAFSSPNVSPYNLRKSRGLPVAVNSPV